MEVIPTSLLLPSTPKLTLLFPRNSQSLSTSSFPSSWRHKFHSQSLPENQKTASYSYRYSSRGGFSEEEDEDKEEECSFEEAVELFNKREYYKCHDVLETLWNESQGPTRTLLHGILQCAVGLYHLFNQNHKGAMMELGEGLCKLRKMNFENGPFHQFEKEISDVLDFIYQTQLELAACTDELCLTMDQSERSYQLLGGYASGQPIYRLDEDQFNFTSISFCPERFLGKNENFSRNIKLPILLASEDHLIQLQSNF